MNATATATQAYDAKPEDKARIEKWERKLKRARGLRGQWEAAVWKRLLDAYGGALLCQAQSATVSDPDAINGLAQVVDVLLPHLAGTNREVTVAPKRFRAGEDQRAKYEWASLAGDQATALMHAVGMYRDGAGRPGELHRAVANSLWSIGILVFGFEPRAGVAQTEGDERDESAAGEQVDLDWVRSGRRELADADMPHARCILPTECLFDPSYGDIGKARWFCVEEFVTLAEAKALYPQFAKQWTRTHDKRPAMGEADDTRGAAGGGDDDEGLVRLLWVYERDPLRLTIFPDKGSGVCAILDERELDFGIEGLPVLVCGSRWVEGSLYPKPFLAETFGPARFENELQMSTLSGAFKIKSGIATNSEKFAQQLRNGDDNAVYTVAEGESLDGLFKDFEIGNVRKEQLELQDRMRVAVERNSGTADLQLGRREPGNPTATEAAQRASHISSRMAGILEPARNFEAETARRLLAIAYTKLDFLHGMALSLGQGPDARLAAFDVNRPVIGELIDYEVDVDVADEMTDADEYASAQQLLQALFQAGDALAADGVRISYVPIIETLVRRSRFSRGGEVLVPLPPPPPQPAAMPMDPNQAAQAGGMAPPAPQPAAAAPPLQPQAPPPPGPDELIAALEQLPEGDPREEELLAQLAALEAAA